MPAAISIIPEGDGLVRFEGRLAALEGNLGRIAEASVLVVNELERYTEARWGDGVSVDDGNIQESTLARWPDWKALENTGDLKASLTKSGAKGAVRDVTPYGFTWGTQLRHAKFLSKGTRKMVSKPVVADARALRGLTGYYMRQYLLRNVTPMSNEGRWSSVMAARLDRKAYGDMQSFRPEWRTRMSRVSRWTL